MSVPEANYRSLAVKNNDLSINEFLEESKSYSCKKANIGIKVMFNSTMDSLNQMEGSDKYLHIDDIHLDDLPSMLCRFLMVVSKKDGGCYNSSSLNTHYMSLARYLKEGGQF